MNKYLLFLGIFLLMNVVSAEQVCQTYDDFSSGVLDESKWEVRQDIEGQPLMDEYGVRLEDGNYLFHTQQNTSGDKRVYLVPKYKFGVGDILEYDVSMNSGANVNLLVGGSCSRCAFGIIPSSVGNHHVAVIFNSDQIAVEVDNNFLGNAPIGSTEHVHDLYVGAMFGNHIDFDNFVICSEQTSPSQNDLEQRITELEKRVQELENRTSSLESLVSNFQEALDNFIEKVESFIKKLPKGLRKSWN